MTKPLPFADESFDIIFHPVSNDYIKEVKPVFKECFRVLRRGGILLCGLSNQVNFLVSDDEKEIVNKMPFDPLTEPAYMAQLREQDCGVQFSHTVEEQIGGQLEAGFVLTHLYGDVNAEGWLHDLNAETYAATRAIKR